MSAAAVPVTSSGWLMTGAVVAASGDRGPGPTACRDDRDRAGHDRHNRRPMPPPPDRRFPRISRPGNWRPMCDVS